VEQDGCHGRPTGPDGSQGLRAARSGSYYNDGLKADAAWFSDRAYRTDARCREACLADVNFAMQLNNFFLFLAPERSTVSRPAPAFPTEYQ
jgi:hypothetical protein